MKRLFIVFFMILISVTFLSIGEAQKKQPAKANPCLTDCKKENRKCMNLARKAKKADRKAKIADCDKAFKECRENCDKPKEEPAK